jgi:hypothetical protein
MGPLLAKNFWVDVSDASDDATIPACMGVRFVRCDRCCGNFEMLKCFDAENCGTAAGGGW